MMHKETTPCCPQFNKEKWEGKTQEWSNKMFVHDHVFCLMHFPIWIGGKIGKMWKKIEDAKAWSWNNEDYLILFNDPSPFRSDIYMMVDKPVEGMDNVTISGTFLTKTFQWDYHETPKFMKEMQEYVEQQGKTVKKMYMHSAYCPKCAKHYQTNWHILFAEI